MKSWADFIQKVVTRVDRFSSHKMILAVMMLYQGVMLLFHPGTASEGMAKGIAVSMALAVGGILVDREIQKKKDWKAMIPALITMALSGYFYLHPTWLAGTVRYLMAFSVLATGLANLAQTFHLETLLKKNGDFWQKVNRQAEKTAEASTLAEIMMTAFKTDISKRLKPTQDLLTWFHRSGWLSWLTGVLMTVLGVFLLVYSVQGHSMISVIAGAVMAITALADLYQGIQLYRLNRRAKQETSENAHEWKTQK